MRLRVPDEGETVVRDVIRGESRFENALLDDFVIARADRSPLYNFAVAVDDLEMGITHVVRGDDHLSNTPRQLLVLGARRRATPYAHLPLLHGPDGKPLSKRHGAVPCRSCAIPATSRRRCATTWRCWAGATTRTTTFFTTEELIEKFSLERVSRSPAVFDEQKLRWMNGHYIREMDSEELPPHRRVHGTGGDSRRRPTRSSRCSAAVQDKVSTLAEVPAWSASPSVPSRSIRRPGTR